MGRRDKLKITISDLNISLHRASEFGHVEMVSLLLDRGVDKDATDDKGRTALHIAIINSVLALRQKGANFEARDAREYTPLFYAARCPALISMLVDWRVNMKARNGIGDTVLQHYLESDQLDAAHLLINCGCDIETLGSFGITALHKAAKKNHANSVMLLLDRGIDPNTCERSGYTPLHYLLHCDSLNNMEAAKLLLL